MRTVLFFIVISIIVIPPFNVDAKSIKIQGRAINSDGKLVYIENHTKTFDNKLAQLQVEYVNPQTNITYATLNVNYLNSRYMPESTFNNKLSGFSTKSIFDISNKELIFSFKPTSDSKSRSKSFEIKENLITIHGLNYFIIDNFDELIQKKTKKIKMILAAKLEYYSFKLSLHKKSSKEVTFNVEIDSWLIRMFAPKLKLTYSLPEKKFIRFEGVSNLIPGKEKIQDVVVKFTYL